MDSCEDTGRAAVALCRAVLDGDTEGADTIVATTRLDYLAHVLAGMAVQGLRMFAEATGCADPDDAVRREFTGFLAKLPQH